MQVATPLLLRFTLPHPLIVLPPASKLMVPVGVPVIGETAETVAVNVTDWPWTLGLALELSVVEVLELTVCVTGAGDDVVQVPLGV